MTDDGADLPPVLIVHGYLATAEMMVVLQARLLRAGLTAYTVNLPFLNLGDIPHCARRVQRAVRRLLRRTGAPSVDLIGVSSGGLIAYYYLLRLGGRHRVRRFIAVGTPFRGSKLAYFGVLALGLISPSAWQTLPDSPFIRMLMRAAPPRSVSISSVFASNDPVAPTDTARLEGATNIDVGALPFPVSHQCLILSGRVARTIARLLTGPPPPSTSTSTSASASTPTPPSVRDG